MSDKTFSVFVDGTPYQTDRSNANWDAIKRLVNDPETTADQLIDMIKPIGAVSSALQGVANVEIVGDEVFVNDEVLHSELARRVVDILNEGLSTDPWVMFIQNVYANPFAQARNELYDFLAKHDMPITPDGCFLAYKIVAADYTDIYTANENRDGVYGGGKFDNSVGQVVTMPREDVDPSRFNVCSRGLHFCSKNYLPEYGTGPGTHVMLVKINPADVVSIPTDYGRAKGRTWRYEVVGEISRELAGIRSWLPVDATWDSPEDGDEEESPSSADEALVVNTNDYGTLTLDRFKQMVQTNGGTYAGLARNLGIPSGTVSDWAKRFRAQGAVV